MYILIRLLVKKKAKMMDWLCDVLRLGDLTQCNSALVAGIEKFRHSSCEGVVQNGSGRRGDVGVMSERKTFSEIDNSEREFAKSKIPGGGNDTRKRTIWHRKLKSGHRKI